MIYSDGHLTKDSNKNSHIPNSSLDGDNNQNKNVSFKENNEEHINREDSKSETSKNQDDFETKNILAINASDLSKISSFTFQPESYIAEPENSSNKKLLGDDSDKSEVSDVFCSKYQTFDERTEYLEDWTKRINAGDKYAWTNAVKVYQDGVYYARFTIK